MPIRHKLPQWAILIVTLVSCAGTPSKPETSAPDTVQLTFAWPTIDGSVRRTHVEQSDANPAEETAVTYTVTATREASAVEVAYTDPREVDIPGLAPEELEAVRVMFEATPVLTLQDGRVTAISNGDGLREILDELAPIPDDAGPEVREMMEKSRTDEFFLDAARGEWHTITSLWHGQQLELGKPVKGETLVQVLMLPRPVRTNVTAEYLERLKCPGDESRSCVRLRYTSSPDPEAMAAGLAWIADDARRKGQNFSVEQIERTLEAEVISDPDTLLPYVFVQTETTKVESTSDGKPMTNTRYQERREVYTWNR